MARGTASSRARCSTHPQGPSLGAARYKPKTSTAPEEVNVSAQVPSGWPQVPHRLPAAKKALFFPTQSGSSVQRHFSNVCGLAAMGCCD